MKDVVYRQDAIDAVYGSSPNRIKGRIAELPSVPQEPISDAYARAVLTWLIDYQIRAAELKGRYTPYEVLSWVVNDWRNENEGTGRKTSGD